MSKTKPSTANTISAAIQAARRELDRLDSEVGRLQNLRAAIASAPCSRAEAVKAMRSRIDNAAAAGRKQLADTARQFARPDLADRWDPADALDTWLPARESYRLNRSLLIAIMAEPMAAALEAEIAADPRYDEDHAMPEADRRKRLAELDAQIAAAEARRDAAEAELRAAGFVGDDNTDAPTEGGDRGMAAFHEQHERQRQQKNSALKKAGVREPAGPRVVKPFSRDQRVAVGEG